jgi:hypothetical protein
MIILPLVCGGSKTDYFLFCGMKPKQKQGLFRNEYVFIQRKEGLFVKNG